MKNLILSLLVVVVAGCAQSKQGANGVDGQPGQPGQPGTPGTPVIMVQFCPNSPPPTYPTVFPEYGFCIGGNLFATYSSNGGFTTLIVPGTYQSNAIGSSCTFKVSANCQVVQQ